MKRLIYILLLWTGLSGALPGQNISFQHYTNQDGLPVNNINDIVQDHDGFIWLATDAGLCRYDGYSFKTYSMDMFREGSLPSNLVFRLGVDDSNKLWIMTIDRGLCSFDLKTEQIKSIDNTENHPEELLSGMTRSIKPMNDGLPWLIHRNRLYLIQDVPGGFHISSASEALDINLPGSVLSLKKDLHGNVLLGSMDGLYVLGLKDKSRKLRQVSDLAVITHLCMDGNRVFLGTGHGIFMYEFSDSGYQEFISRKIADITPTCIEIDQNGTLFVGTAKGLRIFQRSGDHSYYELSALEQHKSDQFPKEIKITSIFRDRAEIIWIATHGDGLYKYNPGQKKFERYSNTGEKGGISFDKILAVKEDSYGNIWFSNESYGINVLPAHAGYDFRKGMEYFPDLQGYVTDPGLEEVTIENEHYIWTGKGGGDVDVVQFNLSQYPFEPSLALRSINGSFEIFQDSRGIIWLGSYGGGMVRFDPERPDQHKRFHTNENPYGLSNNFIRCIREDSRENIWIATARGLNLISMEERDKENPVIRKFYADFGDTLSLSYNYILSMYETRDGHLWLGTSGGGLNRMNYHPDTDSIRFIAYTKKDGLPDNTIQGILEDEQGNLWISTNMGLSRFNKEEHSFINYDVDDGLQGLQFVPNSCCVLRNGKMVFGGVNGYNVFHPGEIVEDSTPPILAFTDFQLLNKSISPGETLNGRILLSNSINHTDKIRLRHHQNMIAIYFSALHYTAPQKNLYQYILDGYDEDWISTDVSERFAKYTGLPHGEYTFRIRAANNDGIWNNEGKQVLIEIRPPWWKTWWSFLIYTIIIIFLVLSMRYVMLRQERLKQAYEFEKLEYSKDQEIQQAKTEFFMDISHEFKTPLTLISGPVEKLGEDASLNLKAKQQIALIQRNATRLVRLINQMLDLQKIETRQMKLNLSKGDMFSFIESIYKDFIQMAESQDISYQLEMQTDCYEDDVYFDPDKVEKMFYNLLSNAFKYTSDHGKITVRLSREIDEFSKRPRMAVSIADTGVGIAAENLSRIFDRFYRSQNTMVREKSGTGIGLSLAKELVILHQGDILVESTPGEGSIFTLLLPLDLEPDQGTEQETAHIRKPLLSVFPGVSPVKEQNNKDESKNPKGAKAQSLLIVDDNEDIRLFIRSELGDKYHIEEAENGEVAQDLAEKNSPDLIVTDVLMPVMDGFELCKRLKTSIDTSHIPVIMLTAKSARASEIQGLTEGADDYISKPFNINVLRLKIENILRTREHYRALFRDELDIDPRDITTTNRDREYLARAIELIENNLLDREINVQFLCEELGTSQSQLYRKLKAITGSSSNEFIRTVKLKKGAKLLADPALNISEIGYMLGFKAPAHFSRAFKDSFGSTPKEYRMKLLTNQKEKQ
jgi:signal transduction histidine kinase/ligand-binding sensor domain-containing protein/DNA-binding response OmpR family regulator